MQVGRYEVLQELGQGGMARVFLAHDPQVGRQVALKVLLEANQATSRYRTRFDREAHALARITHPNVARVYELGEHKGAPFIVLAYYPRGSLADTLSRSGPLSVPEALELGLQLTRGLEAVHAQGVLHRDLKPDNVLFGEDGVALLTDFGLAKDLGRESTTQDLTKSGTLQGTPGFWAPEQARGTPESVGPQTDVYGLGAILYAALSGQAPIVGESLLAILAATEAEAPRPLRAFRDDVPPRLEALVLRCLEKDPSRRWPDAAALRTALLECQAEPTKRGLPWRILFLAGAGASLGGALSFALAKEGPQHPSPSPQLALSSPSPVASPEPTSPPLEPEAAEEVYRRGRAEFDAKRYQAAAALFEEAARAEHPAAQNALGMLYTSGQGLEADPARAADCFRRAVQAGYPQASLNLGLLYQRGQGVEQDLSRARALLRDAAKAGLPDAQCALGVLLFEGQGGPPDPVEAVRLLRLAAKAGKSMALRYLGHAYSSGKGVAENHSKAVLLYRQGAQAGDRESLVALAHLHRMGKGTPRDPQRAFQLFREAARRGSRSGAFHLAVSYDLGTGTPKNLVEAARWFRVAAEAGDNRAMHGLAIALGGGRGVARDDAEALQWSRKAAAAGNPKAMHGLGMALARGIGGPRDEAEGLAWLERAADLGHVEAMFNLGIGLSNGEGVEDIPRAAEWYKRAAARGHAKATFNLALLLDSQPDPAHQAQAIELYQRAARGGDPKAMLTLGRKFATGEGVAQDREQALKWLREAAASKDPRARAKARTYLERLSR